MHTVQLLKLLFLVTFPIYLLSGFMFKLDVGLEGSKYICKKQFSWNTVLAFVFSLWHGHFWDILDFIRNLYMQPLHKEPPDQKKKSLSIDQFEFNENFSNCVWIPKEAQEGKYSLFPTSLPISNPRVINIADIKSSGVKHLFIEYSLSSNIPPYLPSPCHKYCWCENFWC